MLFAAAIPLWAMQAILARAFYAAGDTLTPMLAGTLVTPPRCRSTGSASARSASTGLVLPRTRHLPAHGGLAPAPAAAARDGRSAPTSAGHAARVRRRCVAAVPTWAASALGPARAALGPRARPRAARRRRPGVPRGGGAAGAPARRHRRGGHVRPRLAASAAGLPSRAMTPPTARRASQELINRLTAIYRAVRADLSDIILGAVLETDAVDEGGGERLRRAARLACQPGERDRSWRTRSRTRCAACAPTMIRHLHRLRPQIPFERLRAVPWTHALRGDEARFDRRHAHHPTL